MAFGLFGDNPAAVDTVENIQTGTVVPAYRQGACVINADDGSLGADWRSLYVLHLEQLHPCTGSELARRAWRATGKITRMEVPP